jgi:hypothetical protein
MSRIQLEDSTRDVIAKMAGSSTQATSILMQMVSKGELIDPDNMMGGLGAILSMDTIGIYEEDIYRMYKHVCMEDLTLVFSMLRGVTLGIIPPYELTSNVSVGSRAEMSYDRKIQILEQVQARLPRFGRVAV